jgi:hypothetical protein
MAAAEKACMFLHDLADGSPTRIRPSSTVPPGRRRFEAQRDVEFAKDRGEAAALAAPGARQGPARQDRGRERQGAFSKFDVAATQYYVAEAEELLAKARASNPRVSPLTVHPVRRTLEHPP